MDKESFAWVASKIQQAQRNRVYGEVVVKLEAGKIVHVREVKNCKPPNKKQD